MRGYDNRVSEDVGGEAVANRQHPHH